MILSTTRFGALSVDETQFMEFPEGLPGFEDCRRFVPFEHAECAGLIFLQSMDRPDLCFLTLPVRSLRPDYCPLLTPEDCELLGLPAGRTPQIGTEVAAMALLSLREGQPPTANLLSPIVVRVATGRAVQAIRPDNRYGCREPLVSEEAACS
ncbi:MAG: flagellar assembly protein FliW [Bryobacteraceae bacterium]|jgi:flagellar assembly factor FliW